MARMGLAGAAGRWWGLALGLTAFFLPGKCVPPLPFFPPYPKPSRVWELDGGHVWVIGSERSQKSWVTA